MSYYPTLAEDIARAKEILERGKAASEDLRGILDHDAAATLGDLSGGTIYGADIYAAYKLLESFVETIEAVDPKVCELALRLGQGRPTSITCPQCGKTSHNLNDVRQRYCGHCHQFHDEMPEAKRW